MLAASLGYTPRRPEESLLYQVIAEELEPFLARQNEGDRPVPPFVEREFRSFLDCGILERGGRSSHTKYYLQNLPQRVEVTRRHHPLIGRELEVIEANKVTLTIRLANGSTMKMPRAWTNAGGATGVVEPLRCSVLTIEGVRELINLVRALRRRDEPSMP